LPEGIFSNQNPELGKFWTVLHLFYGYIVYFWVFGIPILWQFGVFNGLLVYFAVSGNPAAAACAPTFFVIWIICRTASN
jgi:hypothetical protein